MFVEPIKKNDVFIDYVINRVSMNNTFSCCISYLLSPFGAFCQEGHIFFSVIFSCCDRPESNFDFF
jgi:hypothetical protein